MPVECDSCGYENTNDAPICGLCGAPLGAPLPSEAATYHHRVPTGVTRSAGLRHDTNMGFADASADEMADTLVTAEEHRTDVGEEAALAAATVRQRSGSQRSAAPISDIGEAAGEAAFISSEMTSVTGSPEPLIGQLKLVVEQGLIIGEQYLLADPEILIGRADNDTQSYPDIDLSGQDNDYVHRIHARLKFYDLSSRLSVEHLGGANPTLVNNQPVEPSELVELFVGDRLRIGRVVMRVVMV